MPTAILSSKGQITLPKDLREAAKLKKGDRLSFSRLAKDLYLVKPLKKSFLDFGGTVAPKKMPEDFNAVRKTVMRHVAEEAAEK
ncbi:MAG: AbrB/MazE/SpoVT family DNA-binding domain-containing protein [Candidatus Levybacteria bacterium]|nr:AbrB/MazE/SpoVT family DNA-binding domain-containing protein [Candidatus Levybacteria bacterium]